MEEKLNQNRASMMLMFLLSTKNHLSKTWINKLRHKKFTHPLRKTLNYQASLQDQIIKTIVMSSMNFSLSLSL